MHIKRFEAPTMAEAVAKVREEFGPDAVVLSTKTDRREGKILGRFAKPVVEVTAAIDRDAQLAADPSRVTPDPSWRSLTVSRALVEPIESEVRSLRKSVDRLRLGPPSMAAEIAELRRIATDLSRRERLGDGAGPGCIESGRYLCAGLAPRHAFALGSEAAKRAAEGEDGVEPLIWTLAERLEARLQPPRSDDSIVMYVGPTGAGKTTTLAKVAFRERCEKLAVVSTDGHRVGASVALRELARGLEVPFEVAVSPESLAVAAERFSSRQIYVDTAGRSRSDRAALAELLQLREVFGKRARVHLVLPANTKETDLHAEIQRHGPLEPDAVVVTKTDESSDLGNVVNLLLDDDAPPLAWLANGQRVPEDLQIPDPLELAEQVMGAVA